VSSLEPAPIAHELAALVGTDRPSQIRALESDGPGSEAYLAAARRQTIFGIAFAPLLVLILYLMVFKPFG